MSLQQLDKVQNDTENAIPNPKTLNKVPDTMIIDQVVAMKSQVCKVCLETLSLDQFFEGLPCRHSFCKICIKEHLHEKMNLLSTTIIYCLQDGCRVPFTPPNLKALSYEKDFRNYEKITLNKLASKNSKGRICPTSGCIQTINLSKRSLYTKCKCGTRVCSICGDIWHEGKSCLEVINTEFELYSSINEIKFCIVCKTSVNRIEGCKHITCPICDYEWCWDCGRNYSNTHARNCPGVWNPVSRYEFTHRSLKDRWMNGSFLTKLGLLVLLIISSPIILIGITVLWPLWLIFNPAEDLSQKKPLESFWTLLFCLFIGIFFLPLVLLGVMVFACLFLASLPFILIGECISACSKNNKPLRGTSDGQLSGQKRWMTGDSNRFVYIKKQRPDQNIPTVIIQIPTISSQNRNDISLKPALPSTTVLDEYHFTDNKESLNHNLSLEKKLQPGQLNIHSQIKSIALDVE